MTRTSGALGGISDSSLAARGLAFGTPLTRPEGFTYARSLFPFDFWRDATGRVRTNFDRRAWAPTPDVTPWTNPTTYHVDINRADDTGDGLSWATAKKSIVAAIQAGNAGTAPYIVNVRAGTYPAPNGLGAGSTPTKACALIAVGGRVDTGLFGTPAWSLDTGTTYKATQADVRRVIDLATVDQDGLRPDLAFATSLAACRATPGSWWTDNAIVYVNRADGAAVTNANSRALQMTGNAAVMRMSGGGNMFVSGFDLSGGFTPLILQSAAAYRFVAEDCTFRYSAGDDGIVTAAKNIASGGASIFDVLGAAFLRCDASGNQSDGFNSHIAGGNQAFVFTMDCTGLNNGRPGSTSNNAFTTHDGGKWIDLRGVGARNAGANVAIANDGTAMWCIDTFCYASRGDIALGGSVQPSDFMVNLAESAGGSKLFLENCAAASSQYSITARFGAVYMRGGKFPKARSVTNGGVVAAFSGQTG
ncbi:hypothetical protein HL653_05220 [Sphingomonas sp. AP4-R1]|uniref:hypothetical protein n=1 Tax=Sphingomonas sp. AP4-R1 TaxID=2735134 RepID=UPI001493942A|nr:hypothetical protein [Sphingomonas sp. AP4-R1]QJU57276.1 hypothetical protein HL653_05220 [Sphingomonas sp. AP4-R1]